LADSRRTPADTSRTGLARVSWTRELVQAHADDVVLAAALFKPNAAGSHELTTAAGFGQRQILKARGAYLGERIVIGATPLHVHARALFLGHRVSRAVACWPRAELCAVPICALGDTVEPVWPALLLLDRHRRALGELQVLRRDDDAWSLLTMLLRRSPSSTQ
jgi:hypothetical protein